MKGKIGIVVLMAVLAGMILLSQMAGETLYEQVAGKAEESKLVVIDSGHGGKDPGKVGVNGEEEKEINLKVAKKLKSKLEEKGVTVIMTREEDTGLADSKIEDMKARVSLINQRKPVLAVSVHQNSYPSESIHGAQVFYYTHSKEGERAAKVVQEALLAVDEKNTRKEKANDSYYMLKRTETPVIIVECGFLSNYREADLLVTDTYQEQLAEAIAEGILQYISTKEET